MMQLAEVCQRVSDCAATPTITAAWTQRARTLSRASSSSRPSTLCARTNGYVMRNSALTPRSRSGMSSARKAPSLRSSS